MVDPTFSFGGIASGLDTGGIIEQLMSLERQPIRRFEEQQRELRAVDNAWSNIVGKLSAFRTALDAVRDPGSLSALTAATSSDETAVAVTGTSGGEEGSLSFTVAALAERHRTAFDDQFSSATASVSAGTLTFTDETDGEIGSITTDGTETLSDLASMIDDLGIGINAQVLKVTDDDYQLVLAADDTGADGQFTVTSSIAELTTQSELSAGADAQLQVGALTITRSSNTIDDLLDGAIIDLNAVTDSDVTVTVEQDVESVVETVNTMVTTANDLLAQIAKDTAYDAENNRASILQGDPLARDIAFDLRQAITQIVDGGSYTYASQIGLSLTSDGEVALDESALREALADDPDAVEDFLSSSLSGDAGVDLGFVGSDAVDGDFTIDVSQAATTASATGATYSAPGADTDFTLTTPDGNELTITIDAGMTAEEAVARIEAALDAASDDSIAVSVDDSDVLTFASAGYGSANSFTLDGLDAALASSLDGTYTGTDVIADFGEGDVTGSGRSINGDGAADGLTFTVTGGVDLYSMSFGSGLSGIIDQFMSTLEGTDGRIQLRRDSISGSISDFDDQIESYEQRLEIREATLRQQFTGLETALARLQSQGQWLAGALGGLPS